METSTTALQVFNPDSLKAALRIVENPTHSDVFKKFKELSDKRDKDLAKGFSVWVDKESKDGHSAIYTRSKQGNRFTLTRMLLDDKAVSETLSGEYKIGKNRVSISIHLATGNPMLTCRVFENNQLVSSRSSPYDIVAQQTDATLRDLRKQNGTYLEKTIEKRSTPYPFALKMLKDYETSEVDPVYTQQMFDKMSRKDIAEWNK